MADTGIKKKREKKDLFAGYACIFFLFPHVLTVHH